MKKTADDFLMKYGIPSDTTIGIEGDHKLTDLLEEYRSQSELPSDEKTSFTEEEIKEAKIIRDSLIGRKGVDDFKKLYMAGEVVMSDQLQPLLASHVARIKELEERPTISSNDIMIELFAMAGMKNEDGMKVIEYLDKENGGSIAYLRHDAVVKTINKLTPPKP